MQTKDEPLDFLLKIVMVGDTAVGKTNLLSRYISSSFETNTKSTIGVDFMAKDLLINDRLVKAQIWDTAGQEKFRSLIKSYYSNAHGFVVVYDVTRKETFESLKYWLEVIRTTAAPGVKVLVIGNKTDLQEAREITPSDGQRLAEASGAYFMETSAKINEGDCVEKAFGLLIESVFARLEAEENRLVAEGISTIYRNSLKKGTVKIGGEKPKARGCCKGKG